MESQVLEESASTPGYSAKHLTVHRFTSANAAAMAAKSNAARAEMKRLNITPETVSRNPALSAYTLKMRNRVREKIDKVMRKLDKETDAKELVKLTTALAGLFEQERILDGRPLPGRARSDDQPAGKRKPVEAAPE